MCAQPPPRERPPPFALVCSPDALALRSRDTLNNLITTSPQSWQTSVALPFFNIQGTVIEWDEIRFDVRLMCAPEHSTRRA